MLSLIQYKRNIILLVMLILLTNTISWDSSYIPSLFLLMLLIWVFAPHTELILRRVLRYTYEHDHLPFIYSWHSHTSFYKVLLIFHLTFWLVCHLKHHSYTSWLALDDIYNQRLHGLISCISYLLHLTFKTLNLTSVL